MRRHSPAGYRRGRRFVGPFVVCAGHELGRFEFIAIGQQDDVVLVGHLDFSTTTGAGRPSGVQVNVGLAMAVERRRKSVSRLSLKLCF